MVADDQGNIAWYHPGRLPIRPKRWDERLPLPGTGDAEWRGFLRPSQRPHVVNPDQGWLANWNNMPSVGWTVGDAPATERTSGRLHRAAYLNGLVAAATRSYDGIKAVDRSAGTTAQQRPLLDAQLRAAAAQATGGAKTVLDTILAWDGNYDRTDAAGTVDPGVAAWEALKDEAVKLMPRGRRPLARRGRTVTRVRLQRRRRCRLPRAHPGRPAAGGGQRRRGARRPVYLAEAAPDVRRDRARPRRGAALEVLRPRHLAAGRRARPLERHCLLVRLCARPTMPSATRALGADTADALPSGLVATTWTRSRRPRSSRVGT